ncbi:MAG: helix-turn-helix transcriptional regulator [Betaproteobacteria bacterium]
MDISVEFGVRVRKFREKKSWSQEDLAEHSGLHRTYISGVERGVRNPTLEVVAKLAIALDVTPSILLDFLGEC